MSILCAIVSALCGIALVIKLDTGTLDPAQVAGIGIIFAVLTALAPVTFPRWR